MDNNIIVTTVYNPSGDLQEKAGKWAKQLDTIAVPRGRQSLDALKSFYQTDFLLVVSQRGPVVHTPGGELFFHLSMAELRIKNLDNGKHDHMAEAMKLKTGMTVLDCTLGLGSDAIVASYIVGDKGRIVGIEKSPILAFIVDYGLQHFSSEDPNVTNALRRIEVHLKDNQEYLAQLPDKSFDVVFLDPMFRTPIQSSSNLKPLRFFADNRPLGLSTLQDACRVARKRVVIKDANCGDVLENLGVKLFTGGRYSRVRYGIVEGEP